MKKVLFLLIIVTNFTIAQNSKKSALILKLTESTCNCTTKKKIEPGKVKVTLGLCLLEAISSNKDEVYKIYDKKKLDKDLIEKVGEDIGEKMMDICPETMEILLNDKDFMNEIAEENNIETSYSDDKVEEDENLNISGSYTETKIDGYLYVKVTESSGRINEFVILQNFENVFLVTDNVLKTNDLVNVSYYETELYDPKLNKFITLKVATNIMQL